MKRIKLLSKNLINQIAAGEVIERPASVVKEFIENSIDAGAAKIEIEISNECRNIRVADNGCGIYKDDVALAFSRHATSKIEKQNDLWSISTLGFRGEALASIISVAKVTCITKTADSETGLKVTCENSQINISETGCAVGTIIEIKDLFYNVPARMKFLKKSYTEFAAISEIVQNIALSNPGIAFNLINKKHSILKTTGSNELAAAISEVYSKDIISELSEIYKEDVQFGLKITGFVSNPDFTRSNKKAVYTFINKRAIKCPIISKAIDTVYKNLIPSGRYPYAVLNILIPQKEIDVNVHPAKREVKYTKPNLIFNFVYSAVKTALDTNFSSTSSIPSTEKEIGQDTFSDAMSKNSYFEEKSKIVDFSKFSEVSTRETKEIQSFAEIEEDDIQEVTFKESGQSKFEFENNIEKPVIIGQLDNTYILIRTKDGLQIVDQHIAHERYLYEKLKKEKNPVSQMLLISEEIKLEPEQILMFQENTALLAKYGYELDFVPLGEKTGNEFRKSLPSRQSRLSGFFSTPASHGLKLKRVPQIVAEKDPRKIINDLVKAFESSPETIEDELLISTACRAAVKAGERLSLWQMEELIINWQKTSYPKTCPHGRKISHTISRHEIAGFFGR